MGIQDHSMTFAEGYETPRVLTGSELTVAHKCGATQASIAQHSGRVISKDKYGIVVEYDTEPKTTQQYTTGRTFGTYEGSIYPHELVCDFNVGDTFNKRDVLVYNSHYFEPDPATPNQVNFKGSMTVNIAFIESTDSWEDSTAIGEEVSKRFKTKVTKIIDVRAESKQAIHNLLKVGTKVAPDTILCIKEDELTASTSLYNEESLLTLSNLSSNVTKAGIHGVIDKIEVFYNGDIEDMTPSLQEIVMNGDKLRRNEAKRSAVPIADSGLVDSSMRIDNKPVEFDTVAIRIYITHDIGMAGGDKLSLYNQLKCTVRRVMIGENYADDGTPLDIIFGRKSVDNRIVIAPFRIGTTTKLSYIYSDILMDMIEN